MSYGILMGVSGAAGSGKDTLVEFLLDFYSEESDIHFHKYAFADPIRAALDSMLGWTTANFTRRQKETEQPTKGEISIIPRHAMQTLGTTWGRNCIDENIWVKLVPYNKNLIISDVRFKNEAKFIKKHGVLIHIERDTDKIPLTDHESEQEIELCKKLASHVVQNNGTLSDLNDKVVENAKKWLKAAIINRLTSKV